MEQELFHYGTPRHSGRYPWGSGENPYQHEPWAFMGAISKMRKEGIAEKDIAKMMGIKLTTLRAQKSIAKDMLKAQKIAQAWTLKDDGYSNTAIAKRLKVSEASVRNYLKPGEKIKTDETFNVINALRDEMKSKRFIEIGPGAEAYLGVSSTRLAAAIGFLEDEGYKIHSLPIEQLGTGFRTNLKVLAAPDTTWKEAMDAKNREEIDFPFSHHSSDNGLTMDVAKPPVSLNPDRVQVRFAEDGGTQMDGTILLRRGVEDISLGDARYAQVRILVGENKYLKGMAMYSDDLPDGVDVLFNTNKSKEVGKIGAMKTIQDDPENPFGATIQPQRMYIGKDGKEHQSIINPVRVEGEWQTWSDTLASQVLSKQPPSLAKQQLTKARDAKQEEFDEIMSLTNPTVKQKLLQAFADECDSAAVHLKAAAMPGQKWKVILPFESMSEKEIYAPGFEDGEPVVLIRYPHGGKFEIPSVVVNNKHANAKRTLGDAKDAIGMNAKVAERLSGADFDGDTVLVIPNRSGAFKVSPELQGLKDFDPKIKYAAYESMPRVGKEDKFNKGLEMGKVSNLITDMTIKGASDDEIARAVRHSMVVIDAEKHNLNWKQSYIDNGIPELYEKYQGKKTGGASTLISKATSQAHPEVRKQRTGKAGIDPETGEKIFYTPDETTYMKKVTKKDGTIVWKETPKTIKSTKMAEAKDAYELIEGEGTQIERVYADYANSMKSLANQARKAYVDTPNQEYSPSARKTYAPEVESLNEKLRGALMNQPLERQAQLKANIEVAAKRKANPDMDYEHVQRLKSQALARARARVGASGSRTRIRVTPREWEAINSGAIHHNTLLKILAKTDMDIIKNYATPRPDNNRSLTPAQVSRIKGMRNNDVSVADIARSLGISESAVYDALES